MKSIAFLHYEGEPNSEIQKNEFLLFFAQKGITVHDVEVFSDEDLKKIVQDTIQRRGKVLIPTLGVGRSQEIMLAIENMIRTGTLEKIPVYQG